MNEIAAEVAALHAELATFDRPALRFAPLSALNESMAQARAWDLANAERAVRRFDVIARLELLEGMPQPEAVDRALRACRVPEKPLAVARKATDTLALRAARQAAEHVAGGGGWVLFSGPTGTGKSVAVAWLAQQFAAARRWWLTTPTGDRRVPVLWLHAPTIGQVSLVQDDEAGLLDRAERAEFLILDELEAAGGKAGTGSLASLLTRRWDAGKRTAITTNATSTALGDALGSHVRDRLISARIVVTSGPSLRRNEKKTG